MLQLRQGGAHFISPEATCTLRNPAINYGEWNTEKVHAYLRPDHRFSGWTGDKANRRHGVKMAEFTTIRRSDLSTLKWKYNHTKDKRFYKNHGDDYIIHVILEDSTYCRIKTEDVFKGKPGDPIVKGATFGWVIHGGDRFANGCLFTRETSLQARRIRSRRPGR